MTDDLIVVTGARDVRAREPSEPAAWHDGLIKELTSRPTVVVNTWYVWDGKRWIRSEGSEQ